MNAVRVISNVLPMVDWSLLFFDSFDNTLDNIKDFVSKFNTIVLLHFSLYLKCPKC